MVSKDPKDIFNDAKSKTLSKVRQEVNAYARTHSGFSNLSENNRNLLAYEINKLADKKYKVSGSTLRREEYGLWKKRGKLGLTKQDLKDIDKILKKAI
ncbi:hypothetical protein CO115_00195 [Candidatus Falkowbacteria bacterium CG_4_9_14_3_um_filter_36_9]|uniref:Uncharacterized protein n=2 Tax=Candidatus Falkowiibacteriota TaxID=1752728 RepID=A0A1J4T7J5_9BACT|nr:MAG: hypothetical protein AUJ27_02380 [Candidatus Falkowbacteria bacterium CG1_02_37_44]PIV52082.1 MAG: hypothetical protein COS18_00580 [Candidatus Falkowbacteria bacterium CG02_land_8_20_14_3_00_36_14]PIX12340.1 MAG: hypothetical protein COZ73_00380 [Candidatus Falkowbacteria bacterium CG_4_8_14_3_um_filter_36_11]PJA10969.1 MAG: hypothetical protein COX67_02250 [Candidatus Falkowbacteria bacterium CG_4_10_14_0_2_um_filter_36_22]PJB20826.1 MAG: hypothetical protein CO115_00195 [Candidatus F